MSKIIREDMLIKVDINENNNKFYHLQLLDNDMVITRYGRVKTDGVTKKYANGGDRKYQAVYNEKTSNRKGYVDADVVLGGEESTQNSNLLEIVKSQITYDNDSEGLIKKLVDKNIHQITSATKITYDTDTGLFTSPIGAITMNGILKAKDILFSISKDKNKNVNDRHFAQLNQDYFTIIPTAIANLRERSRYMLIDQERIDAQFDICNTLENTLELMKQGNTKDTKKDTKDEKIYFNTSLKLLKNKTEIARIKKKFNSTKNSKHGRRVNSLEIKNVYRLKIDKDEKAFLKDMDNVMELWHGTRVANLLSILKSGLLMPKETPGQTTGAMFGTGLYFSDQSTKSLNYCDGGFWNSSDGENRIYMFLAEVAMGKYQIPKNWGSNIKPSRGYDSFFAKANESGVRNNEMIVFKNEQVRIKYILEIG